MSFIAELKRRNVIRMAILYGVSGWLLLQVGDVLFGLLELPGWSLRLLLAILLLGFPVALIFSWIYEMTPDGLKKEGEVAPDSSITAHTARRLDLAVLGLGVVALAVFFADRAGWIPHGATASSTAESQVADRAERAPAVAADSDAPEDGSIAVLPFVNMSSDPEQEYFSDGLAESLLHLLAQIDALRVAARTSSFRFKGQTADISDIGRQLNVAHVLEGSVQRAGNTLRVTAQLIKVDDGYHLWSGTYDREMNDVFAIQDEIATRVVDALKTAILGDGAGVEIALPAQDTQVLAAYEAFLRGREQLHIGAYVSLPKAEAWFQKALELDPDYEMAMVSLGQTWIKMASTGQIPHLEAADRLEPLGQQILARNPDSAHGQIILGWARFSRRQDAEALFTRAYELDPDDGMVSLHYSMYLSFTGRREQAAAVLERALIRDPMASNLHVRQALNYYRFAPDRALYHAARARALEPENPNALGVEASVHGDAGRYVAAIQAMQRASELDPADPELPADIALYLVAFGQFDDARRYIERGRDISPTATLPQAAEIALLHRQGQYKTAGRAARQLIDEGAYPRRWSSVLVPVVLQDLALREGDPDLFLDPLGDWLQVDFDNADLADGNAFFAKLLAVPVLRMQGRGGLAEQIVAAARAMTRANDSRNHAMIAMAAQDTEAMLASRESELGMLHWLFMESEVWRGLLADHPRYRQQLERMAQNEREQARLWAQYKAAGETP